MKIFVPAAAAVLLPLCLLIAAPALASTSADAAAADSDSLWYSEKAAADSLSRYWREVDGDWYQPLTPQDIGFGLGPAQLDSLAAIGDREIGRLISGRIVKTELDLVGPLVFNRVEGWRPNVGITFRRPGRAPASLESRFGYGVESSRGVHSHRLVLPLKLAEPRSPSGTLLERPWPWLSLEARGGREPVRFAGDGLDEYNFTALFWGFDPNHYYQDKSWDADLVVRPRPWWRVVMGAGRHTHRSLDVNTTWTVGGSDDEVQGNIRIPELTAGVLRLGTGIDHGRLSLRGVLGWWEAEDLADHVIAKPDCGVQWFRRLRLEGETTVLLGAGHDLKLHGAWTSVDRDAPPQWKTWLGDYGTLRGFEPGEIVGDSGGYCSADLRLGTDIFHAMRVPILKDWRLQPILFADYGHTFVDGSAGPYDIPDWRANVGFGFGKAIGIPGMGGDMRFYLARPVGKGQGGAPWRFTVGFEN